jgi:hypothetical protein
MAQGNGPRMSSPQTANDHAGGIICSVCVRCVDLLGVNLARATGLYQLDDVLEGYRPVKSVLKGFTNQRAGRRMMLTLAFMDLCEQLTAFLPANTPH